MSYKKQLEQLEGFAIEKISVRPWNVDEVWKRGEINGYVIQNYPTPIKYEKDGNINN